MMQNKRVRNLCETSDSFDVLPDDLVATILCKLISGAQCPSDFMTVFLICKRMNRLALHKSVLCCAGPKAFAIKAKNWCEDLNRFLKLCVDAGNSEACYTLGMIQFYCLKNRATGSSLMAKAAMKSHAPALYSLALIQFNGSGGPKKHKDLLAGASLCARAAGLGNVDALRELGHCYLDGYGVPRDVPEGRDLLVQANARELAAFLRAAERTPGAAREIHPANVFLTEWFGLKNSGGGWGYRMCSYCGCGRPETRRNEFRRCSACGMANYCSRGCQALDWRVGHKRQCLPMRAADRLFDLNQDHDLDIDLDGDRDDVIDDDRTVVVEKGEDGGVHVDD